MIDKKKLTGALSCFAKEKDNPFVWIFLVALFFQTAMLVLFYSLPDPLGLSLNEMYSGKVLWQYCMAVGAVFVLTSIFAFMKSPRACSIFFIIYFFIAIADYEIFRFNHQRLSYSFIRTYFHFSNITDDTTLSVFGGDGLGSLLWGGLLILIVVSGLAFTIAYTIRKRKLVITHRYVKKNRGKLVPVTFLSTGLGLSVIPLILFLTGARGIITIPVIDMPVDMRFTLGKHTLTAPILHIAAVETFEFVRDNHKITYELVDDLDAFLPPDFVASRIDTLGYPGYRKAPTYEYKATHPYNMVFIFGESFKGRIFNQMLEGDTTLAPNIWKLANGGSLWFKNAFSGGYPTVRGTTSTFMGFPSHPNRDVPSFYASNHFKGFQEYLVDYTKAYVTVSNPVFDHTLPWVERFYGNNWYLIGEEKIPHSADSLGVDLMVKTLAKMPMDKPWFLAGNTIATHIPFFGYPDDFAPKPEDPMERYRHSVRYTDAQLGRFFDALAARPDFERTVVILLGDHDTPVDSIDRRIPQPIGVSAARIFIGIFSADTTLFNGLEVRDDVASQLDIAPTIMDLAQVRADNHFWGYDLLAQKRPAEQPSLFFSENAYFLGFRDSVLTGGLQTEEVHKGKNDEYPLVTDSLSQQWRKRAVGASKVLKSLLRNDAMLPQ